MKETLLGVIRHILTFGAGFLASSGLIAGADVETAVGAIMALVGLVWSAIDKKRQAAKVEVALNTPVPVQ